MQTEIFTHEGVKPDGTFSNKLGAVTTKGAVCVSGLEHGCGLPDCHCSDGHWISIIRPRTEDDVVDGITYRFDSREELVEAINLRKIPLSYSEWARATNLIECSVAHEAILKAKPAP